MITAAAVLFVLVSTLRAQSTSTGFALVELFTSEGCSSCPPADRLLEEIGASAQAGNTPIYVLAYHVDYWDYIGWKDPYASPEGTARQHSYGDHFKLSSIYTPQMVVNGEREFVGSNRSDAEAAVKYALEKKGRVRFSLSLSSTTNTTAEIQYDASQAKGDWLTVALVEKGLHSKVQRGENGGKMLGHYNVVRTLQTINLSRAPSGKVSLTIPTKAVRENMSVIAFIQDPITFRILGAEQVSLK